MVFQKGNNMEKFILKKIKLLQDNEEWIDY